MRRGARPGGRVVRSREQRRQRRRRLVLATVLIACLPLPLAGVTLAAFSDWDIVPELSVGAGSLSVETDEDHLALGPLTPGDSQTGMLTIANGGTVNADLAVEFGDFGGLCPAVTAGQLTISIAGTAVTASDLCGLGQAPILIGADLPANGLSGLQVTVQLAEGADPAWRGRAGTAEVRFLVAQPGGGFSDLDGATLTVSIADWDVGGPWPPDLSAGLPPAQCLPDEQYSWKIVIRARSWDLDFSTVDLADPIAVAAMFEVPGGHNKVDLVPLGGGPGKGIRLEASSTSMDVIGTPFGDCFVVTNGSFTVVGGAGDDIMIKASGGAAAEFFGGEGNDVLFSAGNGSGEFRGGAGDDLLYTMANGGYEFHGGDGDDVLYSAGNGGREFHGDDGNDVLWGESHGAYDLHGGTGDDHLRGPEHHGSSDFDGGPGHDVCDGAVEQGLVDCEEGTAVSGSAGASMLMLEDDEVLLDELGEPEDGGLEEGTGEPKGLVDDEPAPDPELAEGEDAPGEGPLDPAERPEPVAIPEESVATPDDPDATTSDAPDAPDAPDGPEGTEPDASTSSVAEDTEPTD